MKDHEKIAPFSCNIALIGFMGTGKSTVAECLGRMSGMRVVEMDEEIAARQGMTIPEIFAKHGERYFRSLETGLLRELGSGGNCIISCGGGAALREENVALMKRNGKVVLLTAAPETIARRVKGDSTRPLLKDNQSAAYIADMMEARRPRYEAAADIVIQTDDRTAEEICGELLTKVRGMGEKDV